MSQFIDRRKNSRHKSVVNRQRFMNRFKEQIKKSVNEAMNTRSIQDLSSGEKISIPKKDISEPKFQFGKGGVKEMVLPGNQQFVAGDKIKRPITPETPSGQGGASGESGEGQEAQFQFDIGHEEFLDIFFEDLALPNLVKTQVQQTVDQQSVRAGIGKVGIPANIHILRSLKSALGRKISLKSSMNQKLERLNHQIAKLEHEPPSSARDEQLAQCLLEKTLLEKKRKNIPFIDPIDLKYHLKVPQPRPKSQAVMFCLMDVSGSMDEQKKDIAKKFFILLYLFLHKNYNKIDLVFIRHHTMAKEVTEQEFFYSRETGGTVVSSALELMAQIMKERYHPKEWNIYGAQASDGDNWNNDSPRCRDLLKNDILPFTQYFAYVEIMPRQHQTLWEMYLQLKNTFPHFSMETINASKDVYPVFREFFKKQTHSLLMEDMK